MKSVLFGAFLFSSLGGFAGPVTSDTTLRSKIDKLLLRNETATEVRTNLLGTKFVALVLTGLNGAYDYSCLILAEGNGMTSSAKRVCFKESLAEGGSSDRVWIGAIGQPDFSLPLLQVEIARVPRQGGTVQRDWRTINLETGEIISTDKDNRFKAGLITIDPAGTLKNPAVNVSGVWFPERACVVVGGKGEFDVAESGGRPSAPEEATVAFAQQDNGTVIAIADGIPTEYSETISKFLVDWFSAQRAQQIRVVVKAAKESPKK